MGIKRYYADKDNTITNAFEPNLVTRGTGSNMGLADSLEVFSIYAQESSASLEAARIILQFPITSSEISNITTILEDRNNGKIPASGSVDFYLRMSNVAHEQTVPKNFTIVVSAVSQSWQEGNGMDMENYSDLTYGGTGSNWINAAANTPWVDVDGAASEGGSYLSASSYSEFIYEQFFDNGTEDLEIKVTGLVEQWMLGISQNNPSGDPGFPNYGFGVYLSSSQENGKQSYYTKKFSARSSEYFFSRPVIEARWDNSQKDNRGNFILSSSTFTSDDNLNTLYFYNYYRGQPTNIANIGPTVPIYVSVFTSRSGSESLTTTPEYPVTGGWVSTGVYSASFALSTTESVVYDRWFSASATGDGIDAVTSTIYNTGSITIVDQKPQYHFSIPQYVTSITNLKQFYKKGDTARFRLFTRKKDWEPTIYTVASTEIRNSIVDDAYFKIFRMYDNKEVVAYGTGSLNHTRLSYDVSGSYFDFDMSLLESDYLYGIKFLYYYNGEYQEQKEVFKFRVED